MGFMIGFSENNMTTFKSFVLSDIYSFALVMWEILSKTEVHEAETNEEDEEEEESLLEPSEYRLPFHADVGPGKMNTFLPLSEPKSSQCF